MNLINYYIVSILLSISISSMAMEKEELKSAAPTNERKILSYIQYGIRFPSTGEDDINKKLFDLLQIGEKENSTLEIVVNKNDLINFLSGLSLDLQEKCKQSVADATIFASITLSDNSLQKVRKLPVELQQQWNLLVQKLRTDFSSNTETNYKDLKEFCERNNITIP